MSISRMNGKSFLFLLIMISFVTISGFTITKLYQQNIKLRKLIPYIIPGEKFETVELKNILTGQQIRTLSDEISIFFVFQSPCSACNKNIIFWNRIASVFRDQISIYGIILDQDLDSKEKMENLGLDFEIYTPADLDGLKETFKLQHNAAQTIVAVNGKVQYIKIGDLNMKDYKNYVKFIKNIRGTNE